MHGWIANLCCHSAPVAIGLIMLAFVVGGVVEQLACGATSPVPF